MRLSRMFTIGITLAWAAIGLAADKPSGTFPLWKENVPGALGKEEKDTPNLTPYWAPDALATGASVIVCPGGGYNVLAPHEGEPFAKWLNSQGITAFVLKYRLVKDGYHLPAIHGDAARAVRTIRANSKDWGLDPNKIGIMGSSAGGHLSAVMSTRYDAGKPDAADPIERVSSRPDATILCYAFILFDRKDKSDRHSRFLGANPTEEAIFAYTPARNVNAQTPPCFIWQTVEDTAVVPENALVLAEAYRKAGVPFDLHLYEKGRHGIGLGNATYDEAKLHLWTKDCAFWLKERGFAKK
jgi:acetyl esterase/lipase